MLVASRKAACEQMLERERKTYLHTDCTALDLDRNIGGDGHLQRRTLPDSDTLPVRPVAAAELVRMLNLHGRPRTVLPDSKRRILRWTDNNDTGKKEGDSVLDRCRGYFF